MTKIPNLKDYLINEKGEVFSTKNNKLHKMTCKPDNSGYVRVCLFVEGKVKKCLLHRLLAQTFIPNPYNLPVVNHIDGNKLNNSLDNLEWTTHTSNQKHAFTLGLKTNKGVNNPVNILSEAEVLLIYAELLDGGRICDLAKKYKVSKSAISGIKSKKNWTCLLLNLPDIPHKAKKDKLGEATVRWICEKLQEGVSVPEIVSLCTSDISEDQVYDIKRRKCHKRISNEYSW